VLKIADFNVAKFFDGQYKDLNTLGKFRFKMYTYTGTLAFSAPEIFDSNSYTESVDMWSAGCVLYTMLCGYQPFDHE
jgi:serine/threonine protein kinase